MGCVFFSVQTFATIGYGRIVPVGPAANSLMTLEALVGLSGLAMGTGLLFARFSRPTAKVMFSDRAVITMYDGQPTLIFRIGNQRANQIVEAQVHVNFSMNRVTSEGRSYRIARDLKLFRDRSSIFALTWTVMHTIDETSPLYGLDAASLSRAATEIVVSLTGIDDTFSQTVHARYSYVPAELAFGRRFVDMLRPDADGGTVVDLSLLHQTEADPHYPS